MSTAKLTTPESEARDQLRCTSTADLLHPFPNAVAKHIEFCSGSHGALGPLGIGPGRRVINCSAEHQLWAPASPTLTRLILSGFLETEPPPASIFSSRNNHTTAQLPTRQHRESTESLSRPALLSTLPHHLNPS